MIKVFYNPNQQVDKNESYSPSAGKPARVAEQFSANFPITLVSNFKPTSFEEIILAHDSSFVRRVLDGKEANGFNNFSKDIINSVPWVLGSFIAAAEDCYLNSSITCSLTSGFHHAKYKKSRMFCTFNGLIIAAQILKEKYDLKKVSIIDFDFHDGDGTDDIISSLDLRYIQNYSMGKLNIWREDAALWLQELPRVLKKNFANSDILLYQAGADPWVKDPLGGILTKEQLAMRDLIVFNFALENRIPLVWNLAGGYSSPFGHVLDIHNNTMAVLLSLRGEEIYPLAINEDIPSA